MFILPKHRLIISYFLSEKNTIYRVPREEIAEVCDFLEYMERCPDGVCEIAKEDIPTFCQGLLPVLEEHFKVKKEENINESKIEIHHEENEELPKKKRKKQNYTIEELVELYKVIELKENELKNVIMDINSLKLKNKNIVPRCRFRNSGYCPFINFCNLLFFFILL